MYLYNDKNKKNISIKTDDVRVFLSLHSCINFCKTAYVRRDLPCEISESVSAYDYVQISATKKLLFTTSFSRNKQNIFYVNIILS